jgi:hypothetical protein
MLMTMTMTRKKFDEATGIENALDARDCNFHFDDDFVKSIESYSFATTRCAGFRFGAKSDSFVFPIFLLITDTDVFLERSRKEKKETCKVGKWLETSNCLHKHYY